MVNLFNRFHPERHYMRGPGPKWHKKRDGGTDRIGSVMDGHHGDKHLLTGLLLPAFAIQACLGVSL